MENNTIFKEKNFISIVVYLMNCEENIIEFLTSLDNMFNHRFNSFEFVLVNDACTDNTIEKIKSISENLNGNVNLVNLAYRHGIETAMLAGVDFSIGDFVYEFDTTQINYDLGLVFDAYETSLKGYDIVSVSPNNSVDFTSKIFYKYLSNVSRRNMNLKTETFRIISRRGLNRALKYKDKIRYRKAVYHYSGFNTKVLEYEPKFKIKNEDLKIIDKISLASDIIVSFSDIGTKLASKLCVIFSFISIITIAYTIYSYITVNNIQSGWTTMMMFMSICFTGVFFILAIISKYITVLLYEIQDSPNYLYKSIDRLSRK